MPINNKSIIQFPGRVIRYIARNLGVLIYRASIKIPYFRFVRDTVGDQSPVTFRLWFFQKVLGFNREVYWPVHFTSKVNQFKNICIGVDTNPGSEPGCYIQGLGKIYIGDYTQIAQNVGIISANHDVYDLRTHNKTEVIIGKYCWIGINAVILPDVVLGDFTVVGAGAVVTKSFPDGHCVIAGNPARKIKDLAPDRCVEHKNKKKYIGYMPVENFKKFRETKLWV